MYSSPSTKKKTPQASMWSLRTMDSASMEKARCPQRYKDSTIATYVRRAITHSSTWKEVHQKIMRSTDILLNNGFNTEHIEKQVKKTLEKYYCQEEATMKKKEDIKLYYKTFFHMLQRWRAHNMATRQEKRHSHRPRKENKPHHPLKKQKDQSLPTTEQSRTRQRENSTVTCLV